MHEAAAEACIVETTLPDRAAAEALVEAVLTRRLAACAHVHAVASRYWWDGALQAAEEQVVSFKTLVTAADALEALIAASHPYDTPAILRLPVARADARYLAWIAREASGR
jgi:periplasmic divalent cation tolerance protein